uniref:Bm9711 n=1 Tax=Brugia malayi TaxID=6279 RepID=A0A1I9G232_BRUMA|nr:Bm9711 [Brugia malayi]
MANDDEEQMAVQDENEQGVAGLAQRAAQMLHNLPFLNFPAVEQNENPNDLDHLDRDFHALVHNANALIHREVNRANDRPIMGAGMERVAVGLIDELRNMIEHLIRQRDEMRQLVMQRGLFDPIFGQWDELLEIWGMRSFNRESGKVNNPGSLENAVVNYISSKINGMPAEAYSLPLPLLFEIHVVHELFNGLMNKGYLIERILFEDLKRRILDRTRTKDIELYECTLILGTFLLDHGSLSLPGEIFIYCQKILNWLSVDHHLRQRKLFELNYWYVLGHYKKSMEFCLKALKAAHDKGTHISGQVELLCVTAKILIFKGCFKLALRAVRFALVIVLSHPELERLLCSVLCDYGDCLLNSDHVEIAVQVYTVMAKMVQKHFGTDSLRDGQAMYEYARAAYRLLYDNYSGYRSNRHVFYFSCSDKYIQLRFRCEKYASKALEIYRAKLDKEHYQLLNAEELQALVSIKSTLRNDTTQEQLLNEAMETHMRALNKYLNFKGENANCARIYDYLGSIFRQLQKTDVSEEMFEKALAIKKVVYGAYDHETALTMTSLAYLYLKDANRPREALVLFKKCLEIELNIFGEEYSGLGIIYDGMMLAYEEIDDLAEARIYRERLYIWKTKMSILDETPSDNPFGGSLCINETFQDFTLECFENLTSSETKHSSDVEVKKEC